MEAEILTKAINCATPGTQNHLAGPELRQLLDCCPPGSPFCFPCLQQ